jgi:hypothetical protein
MSAVQKTPIAILQNAWKRIAPLELADNSWDNVSRQSLPWEAKRFSEADVKLSLIGWRDDR